MTPNYRGLVALCLAIALLAGATAAAGVLLRGDGSTAQATSVRGETYSYATTGVYEYNAERVVAEGVGWDWVTLCFAVPALLAALPFLARGSSEGAAVRDGHPRLLRLPVPHVRRVLGVRPAVRAVHRDLLGKRDRDRVGGLDDRRARPARAVLGQVPAQDDGDHEHRDRAHARGDVGAADRRWLPRRLGDRDVARHADDDGAGDGPRDDRAARHRDLGAGVAPAPRGATCSPRCSRSRE